MLSILADYPLLAWRLEKFFGFHVVSREYHPDALDLTALGTFLPHEILGFAVPGESLQMLELLGIFLDVVDEVGHVVS